MLKIFPPDNIGKNAKEKCGEIFCHSSTDFTIYCIFCNIKAFSFEDFLLHIQNVHFVDNLIKTEEYLEVNIKNEAVEDISYNLCENLEHSGGPSEIRENNIEENISVLEKSKETTVQCRRNKKPNSESDSSDENCKPLVNNNKISAVPEEKFYQCKQCDKAYRNLEIFKIHMTRAHEIKSVDKAVNEEKNLKQPFLCTKCDKHFSDKKDLDHHVKIHKGYKCQFCEKPYKERRCLKRHELTHTLERILECHFEGCGKKFALKPDLERHIDTHTTELNFICHLKNCGKAFKTARYLERHKKLHTAPRNLRCDVCGYTCKTKQLLQIHQRHHTGEKPYACEICDKRFISHTGRIAHMDLHSNKRPHVCKVCNASFVRKKSLYDHSFLHSEDKKFKCKLCDSAFKQAAGLAGHMRKHREEDMMAGLPVSEQISL